MIFDSKEQCKRLSSLLSTPVDLHSVMDPKVAMWMLDPGEKEHNLIGVIHKGAPWLSAVVTSSKYMRCTCCLCYI